MKVAAQAEAWGWTDPLAKIVERPGQELAIVTIAVVGVRRGDNMLNAIRSRHAAHLLGYVPRFGAVVHFGEDVAVNVDHDGFSKILTDRSGALTLRALDRVTTGTQRDLLAFFFTALCLFGDSGRNSSSGSLLESIQQRKQDDRKESVG